jgi:hypothetical protein
MAVLLVLIIGTIVFWDDVSSVFTKRESVVDNPKKDKKKDDKDEAGNIYFLNGSSIA